MKFLSYNVRDKLEIETRIVTAGEEEAHLFIQTWVPDWLNRSMINIEFKYSLFPWDEIINRSLIVGSSWRCFAAKSDERLDGLICLSSQSNYVQIEYLATAPWNYYTIGVMRRIGSGLIYYTIKRSMFLGHKGKITLNALPDAEKFYESIGMIFTGEENDEHLKELIMNENEAKIYVNKFERYMIKE